MEPHQGGLRNRMIQGVGHQSLVGFESLFAVAPSFVHPGQKEVEGLLILDHVQVGQVPLQRKSFRQGSLGLEQTTLSQMQSAQVHPGILQAMSRWR